MIKRNTLEVTSLIRLWVHRNIRNYDSGNFIATLIYTRAPKWMSRISHSMYKNVAANVVSLFLKYRVIKKSLYTWRLQYTQLMNWRWPSQNTFRMRTVLYWTRSSRTQFSVSISVWRLVGDTLNITCNFLYCNHQVQGDFLIILYNSSLQNVNV
jgi:hypothetical protein